MYDFEKNLLSLDEIEIERVRSIPYDDRNLPPFDGWRWMEKEGTLMILTLFLAIVGTFLAMDG